jgi:hypothetical protein
LVQYLPGDAAQVVHDRPDGLVVAQSRKAKCAGCVLANSTGGPAAARKALRAGSLCHGLRPPFDSFASANSLRPGCGFYPVRLAGCADSLRAGSILLRRIDVGGWGRRGRRERQTRGPLRRAQGRLFASLRTTGENNGFWGGRGSCFARLPHPNTRDVGHPVLWSGWERR